MPCSDKAAAGVMLLQAREPSEGPQASGHPHSPREGPALPTRPWRSGLQNQIPVGRAPVCRGSPMKVANMAVEK